MVRCISNSNASVGVPRFVIYNPFVHTFVRNSSFISCILQLCYASIYIVYCRSFALELKHKVFLSHSGAQKSFVELLTAELEARHCSPFFDKRSDCLPVGRNFSSLILKAAKQCHVAVVVLSEAYFSSKWLMMELVAFHEAQQEGNPQLKILPLFFKLSVKDLDEPSIEHRWMPKWREHANTPTSGIDLNKWSAAVKSLLRANGIVFNSIAKSEASYGSVVTEAILKLSPPDLPYGTSRSVVGCGRLCEVLFVKANCD